MRMTIEESMKVLQEVPKVMPITKESIDVALETMRKYQKIEQIYRMFNEVNDFPLAMWNIGGVLDGNDSERF